MNFHNIYPKRIGPSPLSVSSASWFVADKRYAISTFTFINTAGTAGTIRLFLVTASGGGTGSTSNALMYDLSVPANDTYPFALPVMLNVGDAIYASGPVTMNLMFNVNDLDFLSQ